MGQADSATGTSKSSQPPADGFEPYISASESPLEFTLKAAIPGIAFGIIFGAANAYLGLQARLLVTVFAFFFVTVASRIVGLVGVTSNPTSGMTIASLAYVFMRRSRITVG